ncbi:hypothetical protein Trco_006266 [Trichoderma cornu-damae]|uniref:Uncharacterized protein n=1 Tax=Trichoderma cornu-damae TaxID=654480 RepID=A0A9P8QGR4_9HYPO|nr:hypothetical protein Trco_006266 [Trichoderma cornu-damae]
MENKHQASGIRLWEDRAPPEVEKQYTTADVLVRTATNQVKWGSLERGTALGSLAWTGVDRRGPAWTGVNSRGRRWDGSRRPRAKTRARTRTRIRNQGGRLDPQPGSPAWIPSRPPFRVEFVLGSIAGKRRPRADDGIRVVRFEYRTTDGHKPGSGAASSFFASRALPAASVRCQGLAWLAAYRAMMPSPATHLEAIDGGPRGRISGWRGGKSMAEAHEDQRKRSRQQGYILVHMPNRYRYP